MYRILTAVTLCFALASAQSDNETVPAAIAANGSNDTDSSSTTTSATATSTGLLGNLKLPPGAVAMIPATESSDSELYVPTSTATPPASFSYEPETTTEEYEPSSTDFYYEPTTAYPPQSTKYSVEQPVYSQSSSYIDYTGPYAPDVVRTESSDISLAMPTAATTKQYYYPPPQPTQESPPPPAFTYAPTTPYESLVQTTPIIYAPSSSTPIYVAPVPVTQGSASFAVGSETIRLGNTATINNTPVVIQTNSFGNTEIQVGTETPSMIAYHSTKAIANLAATAPTTPTPAAPTVSTVYVQPQPGTLTSKIIPLYSMTSVAKHQTTDEPITYDHNTPKPSSTEHVMTYKGHTVSLGPATLAAEPTGWMPEGGRASPSGAASEGAGMRMGGSGPVGVVVAVAAGMGALLV